MHRTLRKLYTFRHANVTTKPQTKRELRFNSHNKPKQMHTRKLRLSLIIRSPTCFDRCRHHGRGNLQKILGIQTNSLKCANEPLRFYERTSQTDNTVAKRQRFTCTLQ
jgi:hypothetical protein